MIYLEKDVNNGRIQEGTGALARWDDPSKGFVAERRGGRAECACCFELVGVREGWVGGLLSSLRKCRIDLYPLLCAALLKSNQALSTLYPSPPVRL